MEPVGAQQMAIVTIIARELAVVPAQVAAAIQLLDEGATVPFIARYRKEATGGLDDTQLRQLEERLHYLRELAARRQVILQSIQEQGLLTPVLQADIEAADTKTRLEDLYRPYKPKRRTKAQQAREAGLQPLAQLLFTDRTVNPEAAAQAYINAEAGISDTKAALEGARQILMEQIAEEPALIGQLREYLWQNAQLTSKGVTEKLAEGQKFADYFDYAETLCEIPSHRALALLRGRAEGVLELALNIPGDTPESSPLEGMIAQYYHLQQPDPAQPVANWLLTTIRWAWKIKIFSHLEAELKTRLKEQAEAEAIRVFGLNLKDLLLAAPAGQQVTMGLDPGIRTGVKVAVVDATGKLLITTTIYPHPPKNEWEESMARLAALVQHYQIALISIGNGTASRETDRLVQELISRYHLKLNKLVVSEAGASVYSASALAAEEFPAVDVSLRGAISIARRLQDPLAELVKIEPKAIGVGQYQHDVNQSRLAAALDAVVEDCVNAVGVDVNTASAALLSRVSGLNQGLAQQIVAFRDAQGAFKNRQALKQVPRLGPKAFEQAAGFLRIRGENPLDASAVHPEAYPLVMRMANQLQLPLEKLIGNTLLLKKIDPRQWVDEQFGLPTIQDVLAELEKPGRDPRPEFKTAVFKAGIEALTDLKPGMILEGVVTNVTNFGAFVDIGVHQDGLLHISQMAERFVNDPHAVIKAGAVVTVKVLEVDIPRNRIALTRRLDEQLPEMRSTLDRAAKVPKKMKATSEALPKATLGGLMADALALKDSQNSQNKNSKNSKNSKKFS